MERATQDFRDIAAPGDFIRQNIPAIGGIAGSHQGFVEIIGIGAMRIQSRKVLDWLGFSNFKRKKLVRIAVRQDSPFSAKRWAGQLWP